MEQINQNQYVLEEILTKKEINDIIMKWKHKNNIKLDSTCKIIRKELKPAFNELAGCMGVHLKLALDIEIGDKEEKIQLFIKCLPKNNKPRNDFMDNSNFFRKEMYVYRILEEMDDGGPKSWSTIYLCNESLVVMPDLSAEGFKTTSKMDLMDNQHLKLAVESLAKFHATSIDYQTKKTGERLKTCNLREEFPVIDYENNFKDCKWLKTAAKLAADYLKEFSIKHEDAITNDLELEDKLFKSFIKVSNTLKVYEDTINVALHKDLWANNIMYKYEDDQPIQAILIDYQIARLGPPAYDLANLFYFNTDKEIRSKYEEEFKRHYYNKFVDFLRPESKVMVESFGYTFERFEEWYETGRAKGILSAICIYPYILMDGETVKMFFDDPINFDYFMEEDRSEPVIEYARNNQVLRERMLEVCEEFCERYIFLNN